MNNCIAFSTDKGGDYVVALKENHGRFERRTCVQTDFVEWFRNWTNGTA